MAVLEHALLQVAPDRVEAYEAALASALPLIRGMPGFEGIEIRRNAEAPGNYLLLVRWSSIADHRDGFRKSEHYKQWRALLHEFYDPFPDVRYFGEPFQS
ncbi:MAG: antibiotic biosynthesis monooxygenase family protein [Blastomonas sp.]